MERHPGRDRSTQRVALRTPEQVSEAIRALLSQSTVPEGDRVELLAGAMVIEALQPHWRHDRTPADAHEALRRSDPELADTIEAIAPMLLARLESRQEAHGVIRAVERLLGLPPSAPRSG